MLIKKFRECTLMCFQQLPQVKAQTSGVKVVVWPLFIPTSTLSLHDCGYSFFFFLTERVLVTKDVFEVIAVPALALDLHNILFVFYRFFLHWFVCFFLSLSPWNTWAIRCESVSSKCFLLFYLNCPMRIIQGDFGPVSFCRRQMQFVPARSL